MVHLDWRVESRAGVSLVELVVENPAATAQRVRVGNRLDGPVWPPRHEGVPEAGWDDGGFEGVVAPGDCQALGYASPASVAEPPAAVVWTERAGSSECDGGTAEIRSESSDPDASTVGIDHGTPEGVVRSLGDPRPPADAVPRPSPDDRPSVPESVESWLSAVEARRRSGRDSGLDSEDRADLGAVARRIERLCDSDESPGGSA